MASLPISIDSHAASYSWRHCSSVGHTRFFGVPLENDHRRLGIAVGNKIPWLACGEGFWVMSRNLPESNYLGYPSRSAIRVRASCNKTLMARLSASGRKRGAFPSDTRIGNLNNPLMKSADKIAAKQAAETLTCGRFAPFARA